MIFNEQKLLDAIERSGRSCVHNIKINTDGDYDLEITFDMDDTLSYKNPNGFGKLTIKLCIDEDGDIASFDLIRFSYHDLAEGANGLHECQLPYKGNFENEGDYEDAYDQAVYDIVQEQLEILKGNPNEAAIWFGIDINFSDYIFDEEDLIKEKLKSGLKSYFNGIVEAHYYSYDDYGNTIDAEGVYIEDYECDCTYIGSNFNKNKYYLDMGNGHIYESFISLQDLFDKFYETLNEYDTHELYEQYSKDEIMLYKAIRDIKQKEKADLVRDILLQAIDNGKIRQEDKDDLGIEREDHVVRAIWETLADQDFISDKQQKYIELAKRSIE